MEVRLAGKPKKHRQVQLQKIQGLVRRLQYEIESGHAFEPIEEGELERKDIECSIKNGKITRRQKDERGEAKDGKKYTIVGPTFNGLPIVTVGKIVDGMEGETYRLITAYIPGRRKK